jgi:hypothetical protein
MRLTMPRHPNAIAALTIAGAVVLAGCAAGSPGATGADAASPSPASSAIASASTTSVTRPASTAVMTLVSPTQGEAVKGGVVHVVVGLNGATIVSATTTNIRPDQGHIHLYVDNNLVSMNYGTTQDLPAAPGTHTLHVEFVASDHVPFNPRVVTPDVIFTVTP